jgi:hydrogenase maturation factor
MVRPRALAIAGACGVAEALYALASASDVQLRIDAGRLPVRTLTARLCDALEVNPLGLHAGGSLIGVWEAAGVDAVLAAGRVAGIVVERVGWVAAGPARVELVMGGSARAMARFARDEVARVLERDAGGLG